MLVDEGGSFGDARARFDNSDDDARLFRADVHLERVRTRHIARIRIIRHAVLFREQDVREDLGHEVP